MQNNYDFPICQGNENQDTAYICFINWGVGLNLLLLARYLNKEVFELTFALPYDSHFY